MVLADTNQQLNHRAPQDRIKSGLRLIGNHQARLWRHRHGKRCPLGHATRERTRQCSSDLWPHSNFRENPHDLGTQILWRLLSARYR